MSYPQLTKKNAHFEWIVNEIGEVIVYELDSEGQRMNDFFWVHTNAEEMLAGILERDGIEKTAVRLYSKPELLLTHTDTHVRGWAHFIEIVNGRAREATRQKLIGAYYALWQIGYPLPIGSGYDDKKRDHFFMKDRK